MMITAEFSRGQAGFRGLRVSGHSGFADAGEDIVCAAVSSAVMLAANAITDIVGEDAQVALGEDELLITLPTPPLESSVVFLQALHLHLTLLSEQYLQHITVMEV